jgi:hypothetical protein
MALVIGYSPLLVLLGLLDKLRRTINHKTSSHLKNYRSDKPETARNSIPEYSFDTESPASFAEFFPELFGCNVPIQSVAMPMNSRRWFGVKIALPLF